MMSVSTSEESERRLAEALRAQATGVGRPGFAGRDLAPPDARPTAGAAAGPGGVTPAPAGSAVPRRRPAPEAGLRATLVSSRFPLLLVLLGGIVLGVALALLSLLAPGVLPVLG
jgi:hypothetical protein